jgi:hypothetical protein
MSKLRAMGIPRYIIQAFSLAWQAQKNAIKAKKHGSQKYFTGKEK